jgi:hypothetical protein
MLTKIAMRAKNLSQRLWNRYHACMETIPTDFDHADLGITGRGEDISLVSSGEHRCVLLPVF